MSLKQPATWRVLGLSVAAGYLGLGLFALAAPRRAAWEYFGIEDVAPPTTVTAAPARRADAVPLLMPLLGARDISIGAALCAFAYAGRWREAGTLVLAGTVLCAADVVAIWKTKGRNT